MASIGRHCPRITLFTECKENTPNNARPRTIPATERLHICTVPWYTYTAEVVEHDSQRYTVVEKLISVHLALIFNNMQNALVT